MASALRRFKNRLTGRHDALQALRMTPLCIEYDDRALHELAKRFERMDVKAGEIVYRQGDDATFWGVVFRGALVVKIRRGANNPPVEICDKTAGDFVGDDGVLTGKKTRTVILEAKTPAAIFILPTSVLLQMKRDYAEDQQPSQAQPMPLLVYVGTALIENSIAKLPMFGDITHHIPLIARMLHYRVVDEGEHIIREGGIGDTMYFVERGHFHVTMGEGSTAIVRDEIKAGEFFGETALLMQIPRTGNVVATEPSLVFELRASEFKRFLNVSIAVEERLRRRMLDRIAGQFRKYKVPFFESLTDDAFLKIAQMAECTAVDEHTVVFREGDVADRFYMIVHGDVMVQTTTSDGNEVARVLGPGSVFGEVALMTGSPRTATVTTASRCVFLTLERAAFLTEFGNENSQAATALRINFTRPESITLTDVLRYPKASEILIKFAESEMSAENIQFWLACERFATSSEGDTAGRARALFVTYLGKDASQEVAIPANVLNRIRTKLRDPSTIDVTLYMSAQAAVTQSIQLGTFQRFRNSPLFQQLISVLRGEQYSGNLIEEVIARNNDRKVAESHAEDSEKEPLA